jgi:hypothetical protein
MLGLFCPLEEYVVPSILKEILAQERKMKRILK